MTILTMNIKSYLITAIVLLSALAAIVPDVQANKAIGAPDEEFYRRMLNTDIRTLEHRAREIVVTNPDSAKAYLNVVAARYSPDMSKKDKYVCASTMNNLGYLHFYHNNDPVLAYSYLVRGMNVAEEIGAKDLIAYMSLNMANVFGVLDEYDSSLNCFRKSIAAGLEVKEYEPVLISLSNAIALIYSDKPHGKLSDIVPEIRNIHRLRLPELPMFRYTMSLLAGAEAWDRGDYSEAERHLTASLSQIKTDLTPERFRQMSLALLANLEYARHDYKRSLGYLHQSLAESSAPDIRAALYNQLQRCHEALGDSGKANYYMNRYVTLTDTLLRSGQSKALRDIEMQNSAAEFNRRIERADDERQNLVVVIWVTLVAMLVMMAFGIWLWISRKKLQGAYEELYRQAKARALPIKPDASETGDATDTGSVEQGEVGGLADRLCKIMETEPEVFRHDFSIDSLARLADAPVRKVSQTINSHFGTNFNTFLQKYRVTEACRRLDDRERYGNHTIEAISEGLGFKSRSNFVAVFKKFTGLTPSVYQKIGASRSEDAN